MSKLATAAAATGITGTGAAGLYGAHHMGWLGGSSEAAKPVDPKELPRTLDEFKKVDGGHCLQTTFPGIPKGKKISEQKSDLTQISNQNEVKFGGDSNDVAKGCLVVNWDKEKLQTGKSSEHNFRMLWTLAVGNKGFAVYLSGTFDDTFQNNPEMKFDGVAYLFGKNQKGNWEPTHQLNPKNDLSLNNSIRMKMPSNTTYILPQGTYNQHWNFLDKNQDKLLANEQTTPFRKYWHWKQNKSSQHDVMSWCQNLPIWWIHFFDTQKWDMPGALAGVEKGEWVEGVEQAQPVK